MRIAAYNILSGGFTTYNYESKTPERLQLLIKAIKEINADFIGLIDTFRWDSLFTESELRKIFNYKYVHCINLQDERLKSIGANNGITILSNIKFNKVQTIRLFNRNAVKATLINKGKCVDIFTIYLDDQKEETRLNQINALLKLVSDNTPTIVMGDLNAFSPLDSPKVIRVAKEISYNNKQLEKTYSPIIKEMAKSQAIKLFLDNGFMDSNISRETSFPTKLHHISKLANDFIRVDYALFKGDVVIKDFKVRKDKLYDKTSDHYPIVFNLR